MNGYPHKVWHGDWFGGKGLGVCQIEFAGFDIHLFTSHYHAEYSRLVNREGYCFHAKEGIRLRSYLSMFVK